MNSTSQNLTVTTLSNASYASCDELDVVANFSAAAKRYYKALIAVSCLAIAATIVTNSTFIAVMMRHRRRITTAQKMLMILAGVDLTLGLTIWPLKTYFHNLQLRETVDCSLLGVNAILGYSLMWTTLITLFLMTLEQYIAIVFPYAYESRLTFSKVIPALLIPGVLNLAVCCVLLIRFNRKTYWGVYTKILSAIFAILTGAIIVFRVHVGIIGSRSRRRIDEQISGEARAIKVKAKAMKATLTILSAFLIAYLPYTVYYWYISVTKDNSLVRRTYIKPIVEFFALSSSIMNPVVYYWRSAFVRRALLTFCARESTRVGTTHS